MELSHRMVFCPVTTLFFFESFVSVYEPLIKSWFDVPTTEMSIFILFVSDGVLFEHVFSVDILNREANLWCYH